ncbi:MAG: lysylphosphatidylglycerol synthase transmembrane domain-containing protein [Leptospira sp.]|jgi:uncharacterized membrane protein YbhN (UPF0104 family)|nr:lysylphosphatidylglycerol synthase transmembrane domain-containing protein [Leptospira sp.]
MKKWILGATISFIAIYFLLQNFNLNEFEKLQGKIEWKFLFLVILSNLSAFVPFAFRWYYLLDKNLTFKSAYNSSVIGVGLNMVLPARGGDLVRLLINKKDSGLAIPNLVSKLFLEKVMDLATIVLAGSAALFVMGLGDNKNLNLVYISGFVLISMFGGLIALRVFLDPIRKFLHYLFQLIKKEGIYQHKIDPHLVEFSEFLKGKRLLRPVLFSLPTWLFGYALTYWLVGQMIGMSFTYVEILFLMFVGAMGVAIPSAPSGIGVFHASVIYGFILMGKDSSDGFIFASVFHLTQFVVLSMSAVVFYLGWTAFSKEKTTV